MKATITLIRDEKSHWGGQCKLIAFKGEDGKSYLSWLYPHLGNYQRWLPVLEAGIGTAVDGLVIKGKRLIDADSFPEIIQ